MRKKYLIIPENLDLEMIVSENPTEFKFDFDYAHTILHDIIIKTIYELKNVKDWNDFNKTKIIKKYSIRRSSEILQLTKHDYNKYMDFFYHNNILWRENYSDKVCRKYQFAPKYFGKRIKIIEIKYVDNINKKEPTEEYYPLSKWFDNKLKFDTVEALSYLNTTFNENLNWRKYLMNCKKIIDVNNGEYYYSRKKYTDNRFHSVFTGISKELRKFLSYDKKFLGEVDISASVPFFLYCHLLTIVDTSDRINKNCFTNFFKSKKLYSRAFELTKEVAKLDENEVILFGEALLTGDFYRQFIPFCNDEYYDMYAKYVLNRPFNGSEEDKINILKKNTLSTLNCKKNSHIETRELMAVKYPTIMNFVSAYKSKRYVERKSRNRIKKNLEIEESRFKKMFKQHKKVAHLLLQTESYFMLDILARKLNKSHSKIPFFTLHDCIVTTEDNLEFLHEFMIKTFTDCLNFSPNFKSKIFK